MKKKRNALLVARAAEPRIVVRAERRPKREIVIPVPRAGPELEALELKRAKRMFRGTTAQGREIIRKITIIARRKLYGEPMAGGSAEGALGPQPPATPLDEARSASAREPMAEASQINGSGPKIPITKIADVPIKPQAEPVTGPPPEKARAGNAVPCPTPAPAPARPRHPVQGFSMDEARRRGLA